MTMEDYVKILETEKFADGFIKASFVTRVMLLRMRKIFSISFNIPEDVIYTCQSYVIFFIKYLSNKPEFDINSIKLDIINGKDILSIALKNFEPIEVIEEIKDNINNDIFILKSKLYISKDLEKIFNIQKATIYLHKILPSIKIKYHDSVQGYWLGSDIINNLGRDLKVKGVDKIKCDDEFNIPLSRLFKLCGKNTIQNRIRNSLKIFGVIVEYKQTENKDIYIKEEDFVKIKSNIKYYASLKDNQDILKSINSITLTRLNIYYMVMYGKKLNLISSYIKKENFIKLKNIIELYNTNYKAYMDNLNNHIVNSKNNNYDFKDMAYLTNNGSRLDRLRRMYNINTDTITKKKLLEILDGTIKKSTKYNQLLKTL